MKLSEYIEKYGDFEINEEKAKELIIERKGRWKPEDGDTYYYIRSNGDIFDCEWDNDSLDKGCFTINNVFKTIAEAKFEVEKRKVFVKLQDYADLYNEREIDWRDLESDIKKYYLTYDYNGEEIVIDETYSCYNGGNSVYFTSIETAKKAIETIGEDRIKKYLFGVVK